MKKMIIPIVGLFIFMATTAYSESSYRDKKDHTRKSRNSAGSYHMMMYEKAEEAAQDKYAIITDAPEEQEKPDEGNAVDLADEKNAQPEE